MAKTALKRDIDYCLIHQIITKLPEISGFSRTKAVIEKNTPGLLHPCGLETGWGSEVRGTLCCPLGAGELFSLHEGSTAGPSISPCGDRAALTQQSVSFLCVLMGSPDMSLLSPSCASDALLEAEPGWQT